MTAVTSIRRPRALRTLALRTQVAQPHSSRSLASRPLVLRRLSLLTLVVVACSAATLGAQRAPTRVGDEVLGIWGAEFAPAPPVAGLLTLERVGSRWVVRVAGREGRALVSGDSVRVSLDANQGTLRVPQLRAGSMARAFWVQRGVDYGYATPLTLEPAGPGAWRGTVNPFGERVGLYLDIQRDGAGRAIARVRNTEFGWNLGRRFVVGRRGDELTFADTATGAVRFSQSYDSAQRSITFDFGQLFAIRPLSPVEAMGYLPRAPMADTVTRQPFALTDGWRTSLPADVGLDGAKLHALVRLLATTDASDDTVPLVHSVLVARRGRLVLEEYFRGYSADRLHTTRSAFKTMTSMLVGAAIARGAKLSASTPVVATLEGAPPADARKGAITLAHALTHRTGLACDDTDETSPGQEDTMQEQHAQPDWTRFALDLPVAHAAGTHYAYCSATINLAVATVARVSGRWIPDLFDEAIARPLGITHYAWNLTPTGEGYGAGGVQLTPRDLLKIGELARLGGKWGGKQLVDASWLRASMAHQSVPSNDAASRASDGYAWHRYTITANGRRYQEMEASGNGGQFIIVVPDAELVVVFTAGSFGRYRTWSAMRDVWLPRYVLSAIR